MSKDCSTIRSRHCCLQVVPALHIPMHEHVLIHPGPLTQQPGVSGYSGAVWEPEGMCAEDMVIHQLESRCGQDPLQEGMELSSGNEMNENYSSGHDLNGNESHGSESLETSNGSSYDNRRDSAMLVESSECHESSNFQSSSLCGSSNAFHLMMANSEHNPSTSGCSSEQPAKAKHQKELKKTLQELRMYLPPEKRTKGKSGMLATLKYALQCIKQVKANEEYYQLLMINESHPSHLDVSSFTVNEIETITSEYTQKNADMFAVAITLTTGKILYISDQAASVLHCKRDIFKNSKFVEFLALQDVSVFYSSTTPYRLPSWSICSGVDSTSQDCMEEKSFFCRIRGDKEHESGICYHPFRMTPYLLKVQEQKDAENHMCCMLFAERIRSGYEAPRIPPDKRIFTTTHTPSCLLQDVDERAIALLGYLPQDLIGTSLLLHLHPSDRPLLLAIHQKIFQHGGQPFDYSPIRFCTRNGEYVTIDTSWSSFINPWSRKVSLIIGRHTVCAGPVNEDVFASLDCTEDKVLHPDIQEITEQIYRMLLQPVHSSGSSGYGSLASNGSQEHLMSVASSCSDGNTVVIEDAYKEKPSTFQELCKDVHMVKNQGQHVFIESQAKLQLKNTTAEKKSGPNVQSNDFTGSTGKDDACVTACKTMTTVDMTCKLPVYSYQQINCLDSVIRYLQSCSAPTTAKRKCESLSNTTSPLSDNDDQNAADVAMKLHGDGVVLVQSHVDPPVLKTPDKSSDTPVVGALLAPLAVSGKAGSIASFTSQCSYSSTIVHVGDKKPQLELEMIDCESVGDELMENQLLPAPSSTPSSVYQEKDIFKKMGLTKEILAEHTQKEEQSFLSKFKDRRRISVFESRYNHCLQDRQRGHVAVRFPKTVIPGVEPLWRKGGRNRKAKLKRVRPHESSDSMTSDSKQPHRMPLMGLYNTAWSHSETSQASYPPMPFPAVLPAYPLPIFPTSGALPQVPDSSLSGISDLQDSAINNSPTQPPHFATPLVTPMVAVVIPNYVLPPMNNTSAQTFYPAQPNFTAHTTFRPQAVFTAPTSFAAQPPFPGLVLYPTQAFHVNPREAETKNHPVIEQADGPSRCSTPQSVFPRDQASPPLFQSRCSSPLQLNLMQLEETPKISEQDVGATCGNVRASDRCEELGAGNMTSDATSGEESKLVDSPVESQNSDAHSISSDCLDILLREEDIYSGTGSASSGSGVSAAWESSISGCNGCDVSRSGRGTSETSCTSKYFGSIDSSENNRKARRDTQLEEREHFIKYVLQDPMWLLMAHADESAMMTYQIPSRNVDSVLKEDREKLRALQKRQPKFTDDQKKELLEVHPWIQKGGLPETVTIKECIYCEDDAKGSSYSSYDEEIQDLELNGMIEPNDECSSANLKTSIEQPS